MQSKETNNWLMIFINSLITWFKSSPQDKAEADVIRTDNAVEKAEVKAEVKDIKRDSKIEKRIDKAKKAISVSKLKKNRLIYVDRGNKTKSKEVFLDYNDDYIITEIGNVKYENAYNWHGRPVVKNNNKPFDVRALPDSQE